MMESIKNMVGFRSWKETYEKWFGVYMALSTKGIYVFDDKVQNTCDAIIRLRGTMSWIVPERLQQT